VQLAQVAVIRVSGEVKQHFDNPSACEHFTVVLNI